MIAAPPPPLSPSSQFLGARIAARPLPGAARSPSSSTLRLSPVRYSATAAAAAADPSSAVFTPPAAAPSLYEVLGVSAEATPQEIKAAYRMRARSCHPDAAAAGGGGGNEAASADEFMRIHGAYVTLSDPKKRAEYNLGQLRRLRRPVTYSSPSSPGFSTYSRRTWETDQCW